MAGRRHLITDFCAIILNQIMLPRVLPPVMFFLRAMKNVDFLICWFSEVYYIYFKVYNFKACKQFKLAMNKLLFRKASKMQDGHQILFLAVRHFLRSTFWKCLLGGRFMQPKLFLSAWGPILNRIHELPEVNSFTKYEHETRNIMSCRAVTNLYTNICQCVLIIFQGAKGS